MNQANTAVTGTSTLSTPLLTFLLTVVQHKKPRNTSNPPLVANPYSNSFPDGNQALGQFDDFLSIVSR